jgi:flavin reductase (DIM6/NTAB) family NADH-FMN oxidoreductase RutF
MKRKVGSLPYIYPLPIVLAGVMVNGRPNFTTIGDVGLMGINPALVYLSSHTRHYLNQGVVAAGCFSINFPSTDMLPLVDYCGQVSGREVDKGALFEVFYGDLEMAPLIQICPVNLECSLVKEFSIQHRQIFIGEVVQAHVDEAFLAEVEPHPVLVGLEKLDPILYALDNRYYRIGEAIGTGYQESLKLHLGPGQDSDAGLDSKTL